MSSLTDDLSRLADEIVTLRRNFAAGSKERRTLTDLRRAHVGAFLQEQKHERAASNHARQAASEAMRLRLSQDVGALLADAGRTRAANHQARVEAAAAARVAAAGFMNDLTRQVENLRGSFAADQQHRADHRRATFDALHARLDAAGTDRRNGRAAWDAKLSVSGTATAPRAATPKPAKPVSLSPSVHPVAPANLPMPAQPVASTATIAMTTAEPEEAPKTSAHHGSGSRAAKRHESSSSEETSK